MKTCKIEGCDNEVVGHHNKKYCSEDCSKKYRTEYLRGYRQTDTYKKYKKKYRQTDKYKEYRKGYDREYYQTDHRKEYEKTRKKSDAYKEYRRGRYKEDDIFRLSVNVGNQIGKAFGRNGYKKNSRTRDILGCSFKELKAHLEAQFVEGMSWDNRDEWNIDHLVPVSYGRTEEEKIALNHYTNFQPLWRKDNLEKSDRLDWSADQIWAVEEFNKKFRLNK